ncbi:valine--tRNA ligase [archaeon]|jgi:valyl-tRNA synthetase|nr:valine--tRNA ligase [archaeon]
MGKQYNAQETEDKIRKFWEKNKTYKFNSKSKKQTFSIDTPPPYLSGKMHIGHAFSYSQQDFIARFQRMKNNVFYPFGTDDNGLPTERYVEKENKIRSKSMSRADFINLCLKTLKKMTPDFIQDYKDLGISCDYNIYYSTIDKNSQRVSQQSFIDLYKKKEIYKKEFPTLWCPECQTTIAQAELEDKEEESLFTTLRFKADNKDLLIATTRPELLPACVAVFVNPKDKRYKNLINKKATVPLFNFEVPILEDESAEIDKGTGVLMICSYGDKYDVKSINRHKLEPKLILNPDGTLKQTEYKGLRVKQARKKILEDLKENNLIEEQKQITHAINTHDKCGTPIEFITTEQWFIKLLDKKSKLIKQGKKVNWYPKYMFKRYENWVNGLEWDWSISRERHFGVPIPVWECKECNEIILPNNEELPVDPLQTKKQCPKCNKEAKGEEKVLDTWATSSMTPQIASAISLSKDKNLKIKIPFSLRPQAHDIIRTWAFYTIAKSFMHEKEIPWEDIMISGYVTLSGEKMSKSKGTGIQPKKLLEDYGADALRFWAAGSKLGNDLDYQEKDLITGKKFLNKLSNASKFVFMNLEDYKNQKPKQLEKIDKLFLQKLDILVKSATYRFETYEYSKAKAETEKFFWNMFADNYMEIVKKRIYNQTGPKKISAQYTLYKSLLTILKLIAPIMPFITEEIYQTYFKKTEKQDSIHISEWPESENLENEKYDTTLDAFIDVLSKVRQAKTKKQKSMKSEIILTMPEKQYEKIKDLLQDIQDVTNAKEIKKGNFKVEFVEE